MKPVVLFILITGGLLFAACKSKTQKEKETGNNAPASADTTIAYSQDPVNLPLLSPRLPQNFSVM